MTYQCYAICQAVAKKNPGIKLMDGMYGRGPTVFHERDGARDYLRALLVQIDHEQAIGWRTKRNLDPTFEGGLDFVICPAEIVVDDKYFKQRGWEIQK